MIAVIASIAIALLAGYPSSRLIDPAAPPRTRLAESFLLGIALCGFSLLALSMLGIEWTRVAMLSLIAILGAMAGLLLLRRPPVASIDRPRQGVPALVIEGLSLLLVTGYTLYATVAPFIEFDFIADWGLKGRVFWISRGIDWTFLEAAWYRGIHPDYPILLPLIFDYTAIVGGAWDDRWIGFFYVGLGLSIILILRDLFEPSGEGQTLAALSTLALTSAALTPWLGLADGPLMVYGTAAVLLVRETLMRPRRGAFLIAALFLGIGASLKNEGLTLIVALVMGLIAEGRKGWRVIPRVWPALVVPLPWLLLRLRHELPTDLATGSVLDRFVAQVRDLDLLVGALSRYVSGRELFWAGMAAGLLLGIGRIFKRERFAMVTVLVQVAFFIGAYLTTPHGVDWHVRWSWERLASQVTLILAFVAVANLAPALGRFRGKSGSDPQTASGDPPEVSLDPHAS